MYQWLFYFYCLSSHQAGITSSLENMRAEFNSLILTSNVPIESLNIEDNKKLIEQKITNLINDKVRNI